MLCGVCRVDLDKIPPIDCFRALLLILDKLIEDEEAQVCTYMVMWFPVRMLVEIAFPSEYQVTTFFTFAGSWVVNGG